LVVDTVQHTQQQVVLAVLAEALVEGPLHLEVHQHLDKDTLEGHLAADGTVAVVAVVAAVLGKITLIMLTVAMAALVIHHL
jgi:hypothetical protein